MLGCPDRPHSTLDILGKEHHVLLPAGNTCTKDNRSLMRK